MSTSVCQTSYDLMCRVLRGVLRNGVQDGPDAAGGIGSIQFRASATLYELLLDHPIDRRGRCRSCRRPGAVLGRPRRRCRVYIKVRHWLHNPDVPFLLSQLASELGLAVTGTVATDLDDTEVLPRIEPDPADPPTQPLHASAALSPPLRGGPPQSGQPDPDHGGVGDDPGTAGPGTAAPCMLVQPPLVHHNLRVAR